jgi:hypothetical protein
MSLLVFVVTVLFCLATWGLLSLCDRLGRKP